MNATSRIDTAALIEQVSEYASLVAPIVASIVRSGNWAKVDWPDLMQTGFLALLEACHDYDPARSSFRTYASRRIDWAVRLFLRQENAPLHVVGEIPDRADPAPRQDRAFELRQALDSLTMQQRRIIKLRLSGCTQEMIAHELGISQVAVRGLEQRALARLRHRERPRLDKAA